jgi:hypothetical protein
MVNWQPSKIISSSSKVIYKYRQRNALFECLKLLHAGSFLNAIKVFVNTAAICSPKHSARASSGSQLLQSSFFEMRHLLALCVVVIAGKVELEKVTISHTGTNDDIQCSSYQTAPIQ